MQESHAKVDIDQLQFELERLRGENQDLRIALSTITEHGDLVEAQLHETNVKLQAEIVERQRTQAMLHALLEIVSRERDDLEIILQTIVEHGDVVDNQWQQKLQDATRLASFDGLTQIANRRRFDEHLDYQWQQMTREQAPLAVILCDIDYFKQYNDAYGHLAGDDCLRLVAQVLHSTLSRPGDLVARYGGEEFAAVLPQTNEEGAIAVAQRMQLALAQLKLRHDYSPVSPHVTVSMGVACTIPSHQRSIHNLLDEADQLLYQAKQQGKNRILHRRHHQSAPSNSVNDSL